MARVARTVVVRSIGFLRKASRVFVKLEGMCRNIVEQLAIYAARSNIKSFAKLKAFRHYYSLLS